MKRLSFLGLILLALVGPASAQFTFTSFDYPGSALTAAYGINNHGVIVGGYLITSALHAYQMRDNHFVPLAPDTILGTNFSIATRSNDRGDVVGFYYDENFNGHGFLLRNGILTIIDFPGANETVCNGINESGTIVGYWAIRDANGNYVLIQGFTWKDGNFSDLNYPGSPNTIPAGINARGDIVGTWDDVVNTMARHAFLWSKGNFTSFDVPVPGAIATEALNINAKGQLVGWYVDANSVTHGFLINGQDFSTIDYPGSTFTYAMGINSSGQIVGFYGDASGAWHGFITHIQ